jgi:hypothetical protein
VVDRRAIALGVGLAGFLGIVLAIAIWAALGGSAGSQRGLVINSTLDDSVTVALDDGQEAQLSPARREHTFVVTREDFPSYITVTYADGRPLARQQFAYAQLVEAEFRLSIDARGIYPTSILREGSTPAP